MILDSSVGRARVGRWRRGRVGATTLQANACEAEQRPRARCQWLNRVRSALTPGMKQFVGAKMSAHAAWPALVSGQLRFLGL